jgi:hypothetical protein
MILHEQEANWMNRLLASAESWGSCQLDLFIHDNGHVSEEALQGEAGQSSWQTP